MKMTETAQSWQPFHIHGETLDSPWLVTCDHATNTIPPMIADGDLGLGPKDMSRHIAYDVGAAGLALALAEQLGAPAILSNFSRLAIDPNRGHDDPTVLMKIYDGSIIPANHDADAAEKTRRIALMHEPYHQAVEQLAARRDDTIIVAIHSFTPQLRAKPPRPWHVGVLHAPTDGRLSLPLIRRLQKEADLVVGDNEPYAGHLEGDSIDRHALAHGRHNTLIELRNDLIGTAREQAYWAARLAPMLHDCLDEITQSPPTTAHNPAT